MVPREWGRLNYVWPYLKFLKSGVDLGSNLYEGGTLSVLRGRTRLDYMWPYLKLLKSGVDSSF